MVIETAGKTNQELAGRGIQFSIETVRNDRENSAFPPLFFYFHGLRNDGEEFCGTADDLETAFSMVKGCLAYPSAMSV